MCCLERDSNPEPCVLSSGQTLYARHPHFFGVLHGYKMSKASSLRHPVFPGGHPSQVLTGLDVALLQGSDENWCFQRDMAVDI